MRLQCRTVDFDSFLVRLGQNLKKARWIKGMTQQDVAAQGITYRYYQELERGTRNPTVRTLFELAQLFDVRVMDLVNVAEAPPAQDLQEVEASPPPKGRKPSKRTPSRRRQRRPSET